MGAKTWMLVYADGDAREILKARPQLDRQATDSLAERLFPSEKLQSLPDGDLSYTCPPDDELVVGSFPGLSVVAAKEFGIDYPSRLAPRFLGEVSAKTVYLHAMHSVVDWFAYAIWKDGKLARSLSLSPDSGVMEDFGTRLPFEEPYWAGKHPQSQPGDGGPQYPLPFHPLDLGEAALLDLFGYQLEGVVDTALLEPETIALTRFKRTALTRFKRAGPWWKFW